MNNILSNDVVKDWGLESLPEPKRLEMVERIGRIMYQAILVRALDILSEKEQEDFDVILDNDATTPDTVLAFLQSKIPTFEQLVKDERQALKDDLLIPKV